MRQNVTRLISRNGGHSMVSCLQKIQNIINIGTNLGLHTRRKKGKTWLVSCAKKQKMIEIGPDLARFEGEPEDAVEGTLSYKENEGTPVPQHKKRRISTTPMSEDLASSTSTTKRQNKIPPTTTPSLLPNNTLLKSVTNIAASSSAQCFSTLLLRQMLANR